MKTKIFMCLTVCISTLLFGACSNDDDSLEPAVKMQLTSLTGGYLDVSWGQGLDLTLSITNIKYDSDGRVISYNDNGELKTINYSSDKVIISDGAYNDEYTLSNGIIVSHGTNVYHYDIDGYLSTIKMPFENQVLTWENGNVTTIKDNEEKITYQYFNEFNPIANIYNIFYSTVYIDVEPMLALSGCFGEMPKNLLETQYYHEDGQKYFDRKYEYKFNSNGYPIFIRIIDDDDDVQEYTLTWSL